MEQKQKKKTSFTADWLLEPSPTVMAAGAGADACAGAGAALVYAVASCLLVFPYAFAVHGCLWMFMVQNPHSKYKAYNIRCA